MDPDPMSGILIPTDPNFDPVPKPDLNLVGSIEKPELPGAADNKAEPESFSCTY